MSTGSLPPLSSGLSENDIPPGWVEPHTNDVAILLWVRNGSITFIAEDAERPVTAGQAVWVPAGVEHAVRIDRGTVAYAAPAHMPKHPGELAQVRVVDIPAAWGDWLIYKREFSIVGAEDRPLLALASGHAGGLDALAQLPRLPMPHSPEALAVAQDLLRFPGSPLSVESLAARQNVSAKTLQRRFVAETQLVFSEWRTRARVRAAAAHLASGQTIATTRRSVGYTTPSGFTHAFERHVGISPREYVDRARAAGSVAAAHKTGSTVVALAIGQDQHPPPIPAYHWPTQVNDCHLLLWLYRGEATIRIAGHDRRLSRGDAIWVPAGAPCRVDLAAESIMRCLGDRHGRVRGGVDDLRVFSFPPEAEAYLLHVSNTEHGMARFESPPTLTTELFTEQFRRGPANEGALSGVVGTIATALRRDPADPRSLAGWAKTLGTTPTALGREFTTQTGTSFPRWRSQLKMSIARELLYAGERPSIIARKLGYARLVSFTKVFTATHGIPPREYVRTQNRRLEASADES